MPVLLRFGHNLAELVLYCGGVKTVWLVQSYLLFVLLAVGLWRVLGRLLRMCVAFRHLDQKLLDFHTFCLTPQSLDTEIDRLIQDKSWLGTLCACSELSRRRAP